MIWCTDWSTFTMRRQNINHSSFEWQGPGCPAKAHTRSRLTSTDCNRLETRPEAWGQGGANTIHQENTCFIIFNYSTRVFVPLSTQRAETTQVAQLTCFHPKCAHTLHPTTSSVFKFPLRKAQKSALIICASSLCHRQKAEQQNKTHYHSYTDTKLPGNTNHEPTGLIDHKKKQLC